MTIATLRTIRLLNRIHSLYRVHCLHDYGMVYDADDNTASTTRRAFVARVPSVRPISYIPFYKSLGYVTRLVGTPLLLSADHHDTVTGARVHRATRLYEIYVRLVREYRVVQGSDYHYHAHVANANRYSERIATDIRQAVGGAGNTHVARVAGASTLLQLRHVPLSILGWFAREYTVAHTALYHPGTSISAERPSESRVHRVTAPIAGAYRHTCVTISTLYRLYYISLLGSFVSRDRSGKTFSNMFTTSVIAMLHNGANRAYVSSLLNVPRVRNAFMSFISGRYASRIFFVLMRLRSSIPVSLMYWVLSRYHALYTRIFARRVRTDIFHICMLSTDRAPTLPPLRYANISISGRAFADSFNSLRRHVCTIHQFVSHASSSQFMSTVLRTNLAYFLSTVRFFPSLLYIRKMLLNLAYQIEHSLFVYSQAPHLFAARIYYNGFRPPMSSAKLVCEYIIASLSFGVKLARVFGMILNRQKYWQRVWNNNTKSMHYRYGAPLANFLYPSKGIRIICSGPPYKARRTVSKKYHL